MRKFHLYILLLLLLNISFSQSKICELKKEIDIKDNRFTVTTIYKIFINEKSSQGLSKFVIKEDNFTKIKSIRGILYDADGKKIKKLKKSDYKTWLGNPNYNMYSDDKYTGIDLSYYQFPYSIEIEYTIEYSTLAFLPNWFPQSFDAPIDYASLSIKCDNFDNIDVRESTTNIKINFSDNHGVKIWEMNNIPKLIKQISVPPEEYQVNGLFIKPLSFNYSGLNGSLRTWQDFGIFYTKLINGVQDLKFEDIKEELSLDNNTSKIDKITAIYKYIQKNTHYVSNAYGVNGWKPHNTKEIFNNKYGDCKDLTFLFINIASFYNIKAYPTLIHTRADGFINPHYPTNEFNHIISAVPIDNDTLWIDCTSDFATIQDLPQQDEDCNVLVIDGEKSHIQKIHPSYFYQNYTKFTSFIDLQSTGSIIISGQLYFNGNVAQHTRAVFRDASEKRKKEILIEWLGEYCPKIDLKNYEFQNLENFNEELIISFDATAIRYGNKNLNRLFFNPNFYHRLNESLEKPEDRIFKFMYNYPSSQLDIIQVKIPSETKIEAILENQHIIDENMNFEISIQKKDNFISYTRRREIKKKEIELNQYKSFFDNLRKIERIDKTDWVLKFNN